MDNRIVNTIFFLRDMIYYLIILSILFFLVNPPILLPNEYHSNIVLVEDENFEHLSINEGLSQGTVKCIYQDSKGFLWFGTQNGLNRYDGYDFKVFTNNPHDSLSISDNNINKIVEDEHGNLWIGTSNGLNKYNRRTESFQNYFFDGGLDQSTEHGSRTNHKFFTIVNLNYNSIIDIDYSRKLKPNTLWIGINKGLLEFDMISGKFKLYKPSFFGSNPHIINKITNDFKGNLIISYTIDNKGYVLKFNIKTKEFMMFDSINNQFDYGKNECVSELFIDSRKYLWIATNVRVICFELSTNRVLKSYYDYLPGYNTITDVFEDYESNIWFTTNGNGIWKFDLKENKIYKRLNNPGFTGGISYSTLLCGYFDINHILWIGTNGLGIDKYNSFSNRFNLVKGSSKNCPMKSVRCIFEDNNNNIWVSGYNGFNIFKSNIKDYAKLIKIIPDFFYHSNKFTNRSLLQKMRSNAKKLGLNHIYSDSVTGTIFTMTTDKFNNDIIWLGIEGYGIHRFYTKEIIFEKIPFDNGDKSIKGSYIFKLITDKSGNIWCGTERGLNKYNYQKNEYTFYSNNSDSNSISPGNVKAVFEDKSGIFWIGTDIGGLNKFDEKTGIFKHYTFNKKIKNSLSSNSVLSFCEDSKGRLWIGTNNGLNCMNKEKGTFIYYTTDDGLPNNTIYGILEDDKGCLWLSTNKGLSKFYPEKKEFYNFSDKDGLQSVEFNTNAYLKTKSGELYFGGVNGFNHFFPTLIVDNFNNDNIVLTNFSIFNKYVKIGEKVNGRILLSESISETKEIILNYNENMITFDYALLSFCNPGKILYKYRLENFNDKWLTTSDRKVTFTNLDPGEYVFSVVGSNSEGAWSNMIASIHIIIKPPFWATWWFRVIVIAFLLFIVFIIFQQRIRVLKKRQIELESIVVERTKDLLIEKERTEELYNKTEHLLLNILPEPIAARLKEGETPIADQFENASVVFIDIVDFTNKSANIEPKEIVSFLNILYTKLDDLANKHGLEKIKTIGDCYMAAAGIPLADTDNARKAAEFAIEVMSYVKDYNIGKGTILNFRCGIDCGPVVAGIIGENKFIYDIWGDMVNTASRMESNGIAGRIQVTERFKKKIESGFKELGFCFEERGEIEIKGKGIMKTWFLIGFNN